MKKNIFFIIVFLIFCFNIKSEVSMNIYLQAPLEFCSYPDIKEGVVDIIYIKIEENWHNGEYKKIFPLIKLIAFISPEEEEAWELGCWFLMNAIAPEYEGEKRKEIEEYGIDFLKEGIEKNKKSGKLYWELAWIYYRKKNYEKSLEYLEKAEKYISDYKVENLKAHIFEKTGKIDEAIKVWKKIKKMYPLHKNVADRFINKLEKEKNNGNFEKNN